MATEQSQDKLTAKEAATLLGLTSKTIRRAIDERRLAATRERGPTGWRYMIARNDLIQFREQRAALDQALIPASETDVADETALQTEITSLRRQLAEVCALAEERGTRLAQAESTITQLRAAEAALQSDRAQERTALLAEMARLRRPPPTITTAARLTTPAAARDVSVYQPIRDQERRERRVSSWQSGSDTLLGGACMVLGVVILVVLAMAIWEPFFGRVSAALSSMQDRPQVAVHICLSTSGVSTCAGGKADKLDMRNTHAAVQLVLLVTQARRGHNVAITRGRLADGTCHGSRSVLLAGIAQTTINAPQWQDAMTVHMSKPVYASIVTYCVGAMLDGHTVQMHRLTLDWKAADTSLH